MCKGDLESMVPLLLHCFARILLELLLAAWACCGLLLSPFQTICWVGRATLVISEKEGRPVFPSLCFGSIWRERDRRVVEGNETSVDCLENNFIKTLYVWDKGNFALELLILLTFVDSLYCGCIWSFIGCCLCILSLIISHE